jgi:hypothetical protein
MTTKEHLRLDDAGTAGPSDVRSFKAWFRKNLAWIALAALLAGLVIFLAIDSVAGATDSGACLRGTRHRMALWRRPKSWGTTV